MVEVPLEAFKVTAPLLVLDDALRAKFALASVVIVEPLIVMLPALPEEEGEELIDVALGRLTEPSVAP